MHFHFLKKFLRETLHFDGSWLFLEKLNNESVVNIVINIIPHLFLEVYPTTNERKKFYHHKILANFYVNSPSPTTPIFPALIVMGGGTETIYNQVSFIFSKE